MTTALSDSRRELLLKVQEEIFQENASEANPLSEQDLADRFGASRAPIRDVLSVLESEGLLVRRKGKGLYLRPPSLSEIVEVYDARAAIEGFAVRLAVDHLDPAALDKLDKLARQFTKLREAGEIKRATEVNLTFHNYLVDLSGNQLMRRILDRFHVIRRSFQVTSKRSDAPIAQTPYPHEKLVEFLRKRDADACERFMRSHILYGKQMAVDWALRNNPLAGRPS